MLLLLLIRKCCGIVLKAKLNYQQNFITTLYLLIVLIQQQQQYGIEGRPSKWNHSIQRRFMWKQMDSTVDGIVDRVVNGARAMKSVIGDFMPPKHVGTNAMDYLPTETTRIKYIIRNPHTKETKVVRVRPSKKVIKLMVMTPKPLMHEKYTSHKIVPTLDPQKLRQLEKEQELIAEGRIPMKSESKPSESEKQRTAKNNYQESMHEIHNEIVTGRIKEFNESWKPVYTLGNTPGGFSTSKPYMMSALHTSIVGELLPQPQKQVYEPLISNDFPVDESEGKPKKTHTYEVTEYTAEESIDQPQTHDYYSIQNEPTLSTSLKKAGSFTKYTPVTTENSNILTQIEHDAEIKLEQAEYGRSQRGFLPSKDHYRSNFEVPTPTTTTTRAITTSYNTTTTEEPNYPAIYLRKYRNRPNMFYNPKEHQRIKSPEMTPDSSNWIPSNATYSYHRGRSTSQRQILTSVNATHRTKSQKWPPDVEDNYFSTSSSSLPQYEVSSTTESTILQDFSTAQASPRKNVRLKAQQHSAASELKYKTVRQRGSIKYGDKLFTDEDLN